VNATVGPRPPHVPPDLKIIPYDNRLRAVLNEIEREVPPVTRRFFDSKTASHSYSLALPRGKQIIRSRAGQPFVTRAGDRYRVGRDRPTALALSFCIPANQSGMPVVGSTPSLARGFTPEAE
jgi:hypothetical protein